MKVGAMQSWTPARGGEASVAALPQRSTFNPKNPEAPRVGVDPSQMDMAPPEDMDRASLKKAAHDFESYFLSHMMQVMRRTIPESDFMGGGFSKDTYTDMLDQEYAKLMSDRGGIGLAAMLERQLGKELDRQALGQPGVAPSGGQEGE